MLNNPSLVMSLSSFSNCFLLYGAQGPTALSNGPTCVEVQGDWIVDAIVKLRKEGLDYCDATHEAKNQWRETVRLVSDKALFPQPEVSAAHPHSM